MQSLGCLKPGRAYAFLPLLQQQRVPRTPSCCPHPSTCLSSAFSCLLTSPCFRDTARTHERTCDLLLYKVERTSLPSQPSKQKTGGFLGLSPASTAWNALPCFSCCTPLRRHLQEAHPDCLSPPGSPRCFCGSRASLIQAFSRPFLGFSPQPGPEPGLVWCTAGLLKSLWDESLTPPESWALPPWDPHRVMEGSKEARVRVRTFGPQSSCLYSGCREDLMR